MAKNMPCKVLRIVHKRLLFLNKYNLRNGRTLGQASSLNLNREKRLIATKQCYDFPLFIQGMFYIIIPLKRYAIC